MAAPSRSWADRLYAARPAGSSRVPRLGRAPRNRSRSGPPGLRLPRRRPPKATDAPKPMPSRLRPGGSGPGGVLHRRAGQGSPQASVPRVPDRRPFARPRAPTDPAPAPPLHAPPSVRERARSMQGCRATRPRDPESGSATLCDPWAKPFDSKEARRSSTSEPHSQPQRSGPFSPSSLRGRSRRAPWPAERFWGKAGPESQLRTTRLAPRRGIGSGGEPAPRSSERPAPRSSERPASRPSQGPARRPSEDPPRARAN